MESSETYSSLLQGSGKPQLKLNNEEIHNLLNRVSSDEQAELTSIMKSCTTEVTLSRGIPITAAILGTLYFARSRLPVKYHFGPKGWPFYAIMGISSMTAVNLSCMGMCRDRIQPKIEELYRKYQGNDGNRTTYDKIRQQHRLGGAEAQSRTAEVPSSYNNFASSDLKPLYGDSTTIGHDFDLTSDPSPQKSPPNFIYDDVPSYMSGTPKSSKGDEFKFS